ncbi:MAG: aspartyl protease family protein [Nonlabens sp.]|nr:aspartyl protease family protein [Nonlabens sp.]
MKKLPFIAALLLIIIGCSSVSKMFDAGTVKAQNYTEVIAFDYSNNFALIPVEINNKTYTFLVDTGAPTVISTAIYEDLNIKKFKGIYIADSQGQRNQQKLVLVPEIKVGNLTYTNIGAVVANLQNVYEFKCMGIDGIIGANQMAKSFWKFDYEKKKLTITDKLENYDLTSFTDTIPFTISTQKTPYIKGYVNGLNTSFTYDTGKSGYIDVNKKLADFKDAPGFTSYGNSSIGLYDAKDSVRTRTIKVDSLRIGNISMGAQVVDLDYGGLIGNDFMNKFEIVMDWKSQKIYLKKILDFEKAIKTTFGFGFRIKDNKAIVTSLVKEYPLDLQPGDVIQTINEFDLSNISDENSCEIYKKVVLKGLDSIVVNYKRGEQELSTTIVRKTMISE